MKRTFAALALMAGLGSSTAASALPGFYAGQGSEKRLVRSTQIVVAQKGGASVITVMPDYEGPLTPFALVLAVPGDVVLDRVKSLKREYVDRLDQMTAPRFHEFWEMDPCEPGPAEQIWEQTFKASGDTDFLGGPKIGDDSKKVAKELFIPVDADFKEGEYALTLLADAEARDVAGFLGKKGLTAPAGANDAVRPYLDAGMKLLVAEVDTKRIELAGGNVAILSPLRYWSEREQSSLPVKLGLLSTEGKQELLIYTLHPDSRMEAKNYENVFAPTNIAVDFVVKERMGELYAALHDISLAKNPKAILNEYAWSSEGCGKPCPNAPILPHELISLGGDVFEQSVPEAERNPVPDELSEEEKKAHEAKLKELTGKEKREYEKSFEEERKEVARKRALIARNKYVISRLHHRYDASNLPHDIELRTAGAVSGGGGTPKGATREVSTAVAEGSKNELQTRFNHFHPWKGMMQCETPERNRWGKPPKTYRGLRKIWIATDLSRKNRAQIEPAKVVFTPVPALGLTGVVPDADAGADAGAAAAEPKKSACGCRVVGAAGTSSAFGLLLGLGLAALGLRRRRARLPAQG